MPADKLTNLADRKVVADPNNPRDSREEFATVTPNWRAVRLVLRRAFVVDVDRLEVATDAGRLTAVRDQVVVQDEHGTLEVLGPRDFAALYEPADSPAPAGFGSPPPPATNGTAS